MSVTLSIPQYIYGNYHERNSVIT